MKHGYGLPRRDFVAALFSVSLTAETRAAAFSEPSQASKPEKELRVKRKLAPLPDLEGFAGMFAGVLDGKLVAAGGANFPHGYPWEGGRKFWHDVIYVLDSPAAEKWARSELRLPRPTGYGLAFSFENKVYLAGGETGPSETQPAIEPACLDTVVSLGFENGQIVHRVQRPLPEPLKDACGVLIGSRYHLFGGVTTPAATEASNRLYVLDLTESQRGWQRLPDLPSAGRFQAIAGTDGRDFFIYSGIVPAIGADGVATRRKPYLREVWRFSPRTDRTSGRWTRLADMPREAAAGPSPAIAMPRGGLAILAGATGADHSKPQKGHAGWPTESLVHDTVSDRWKIVPEAFVAGQAVVTAPTVNWHGMHIAVSGEIAPGRRTPTLAVLDTID